MKGSSPPDNVRPLGGMTKLYARAKRVMESISIITSSPLQLIALHALIIIQQL